MLSFIIRRLLTFVPVLFIVALLTFIAMRQAPGGPFSPGSGPRNKRPDPRTLAALNAYFGLDKPAFFNAEHLREEWAAGVRNPLVLGRAYLDSQFFNYLLNAAQGNLGPSYRQRGRQVEDILARQWPYTLRLSLVALGFTLVIGLPLGLLSALRPHGLADRSAVLLMTLGFAVPDFVLGLLAISFFGVTLGWISIISSNWSTWTPYIVPGLILSSSSSAYLARITRASLLDVIGQDYVRTARSKGLSKRAIVVRHILRPGAIPVVTLLGPLLVNLILGTVIVESIFGIPGVGGYFVDSLFQRDYSMIMGTTLIYTLAVLIASLLVDLSYGLLDPRIRF